MAALEAEAEQQAAHQVALRAAEELVTERRSREDEERHTLVAMLEADVERAREER